MNVDLVPIRCALLSVSDKTGLADFARVLREFNVQLLSTGGTAKHLRAAGIAVEEISDYTGFPEILDGRVKTLHPRVHGGLLAIRSRPSHQVQIREQGIAPIDMVVVKLYPFREAVARAESTFDEVVEQIDIGGPSMVRSAAKNHAFVAAVTDPRDYGRIQEELKGNEGRIGAATRFMLAQKAFACTASYDSAIAAYFSERAWSPEGIQKAPAGFPAFEALSLEKIRDLRYGENPHQRGALYGLAASAPCGVAGAEVLHGKEISYNNLLDADAAWELILEFDRPAAALIKHTNPCGVAQSAISRPPTFRRVNAIRFRPSDPSLL